MRSEKPGYRGYIELKNGQRRLCADSWTTRERALLDAANTIRDIKASPACEWRDDIHTYGTVRDSC